MDRFHLTLPEVANLTDLVIQSVYFHKRTKEGSIEIPQVVAEAPSGVPETLDQTLLDLQVLRSAGVITEAEHERLKQDAEEKYRGKDENNEATGPVESP